MDGTSVGGMAGSGKGNIKKQKAKMEEAIILLVKELFHRAGLPLLIVSDYWFSLMSL
jgi:hypothetical protein